MQTLKVFSTLAILFSACFFSSCDHQNNNSNNPGATLASGQWKVTYFFDKKEETGIYSGYLFDFQSNGNLSVYKGSQIWSGTWTTGLDDSKDKFQIQFAGSIPSELSGLQEDWLIVEIKDAFMHLEHTSGGNGNTDVLHFEKD